jgi:hypothetical protein
MGSCRVYVRNILTVELILQASPNSKFSSLDDLSREEPVQHQAQEIVSQHPASRLIACNAVPSWPSRLGLDLVPCQRLGVQHRGDRASVDVVADEIRDVDDDREEERDGECTGPIPNQYATQVESEKSQLLTVQRTHIHVSVAPSRRELLISNRPLLQLVVADCGST